MIQIGLLAVSIAMVVIGVKGLTSGSIQFSQEKTLTGKTATIVGVICILAGLAMVPTFMLLLYLFH